MNNEEAAKRLVYNQIFNETDQMDFDKNNLKLVWYCKTLQNWKALVVDVRVGGLFYEITHNGDKAETYVDAYKKVSNNIYTHEEVYV